RDQADHGAAHRHGHNAERGPPQTIAVGLRKPCCSAALNARRFADPLHTDPGGARMKSAVRSLLSGLMIAAASTLVSSQTLRVGLAEDPDVLDPTLARTFVGRIVFAALCDKLFDIDEKLNIVPQLATGYEWADEKTLLIRLRPGVKFQNGETLDAAAVKFSLERHLTMQGSFRRSEISAIDHVEVTDPST